LVTHLGVVERNLASESAADLLAEVEAGTRSRCILPWIPLMTGGGPALIDRWKLAAEAEPNARRRGEFAYLAQLFAGKAGCEAIWEDKRRGWNVEEPKIVQEWIEVGELRHACGSILRLGAKRFGPAPTGTETALHAISDRARLERMLDRVLDATGWPELLTTT
jgi:hypothetical protein